MFKTKNDLSEKTRAPAVELLNARLADCIDLQMQCKRATETSKGPAFIALHQLFDQVNEFDDLDTADLFTEVSCGIDKWLWFLEARLQAEALHAAVITGRQRHLELKRRIGMVASRFLASLLAYCIANTR